MLPSPARRRNKTDARGAPPSLHLRTDDVEVDQNATSVVLCAYVYAMCSLVRALGYHTRAVLSSRSPRFPRSPAGGVSSDARPSPSTEPPFRTLRACLELCHASVLRLLRRFSNTLRFFFFGCATGRCSCCCRCGLGTRIVGRVGRPPLVLGPGSPEDIFRSFDDRQHQHEVRRSSGKRLEKDETAAGSRAVKGL